MQRRGVNISIIIIGTKSMVAEAVLKENLMQVTREMEVCIYMLATKGQLDSETAFLGMQD